VREVAVYFRNFGAGVPGAFDEGVEVVVEPHVT